MNPIEIATITTTILAALWGLRERRARLRESKARTQAALADARESNGQYVASLAAAAHDLVQTSRLEIQDLRQRIARLEERLEVFGCRIVACPNRIPFVDEHD